MAVIPRTSQGHGWLRPATGVVELSQCIIQVLSSLYLLVMDSWSLEKPLTNITDKEVHNLHII